MTEQGILLSCGDGTVLEVTEVRLESRGQVSGREFAVGARLRTNTQVFPGANLEAAP
jgi:hypothetical protein